jgi:hypothetical protein
MNNFIRLLPAVVPFLLYVAYLHLYFYYTNAGIDIKQWVEINELFVLTFSDFGDYIKYIIIIFTTSYAILRIRDNFEKNLNERMIRSRRKKLKYATYIGYFLLLAYFFYSIVSFNEQERYERPLNVLIAVVASLPLVTIIWLPETVVHVLGKMPSNTRILLLIMALVALVHSFTNPTKVYFRRYNSKDLARVRVSDGKQIDSLKYLGKTKNYYFFINKKSKIGSVYSKDIVKQVDLLDSTGRCYFKIYN